jgi:uncharacterized integral membrane protein
MTEDPTRATARPDQPRANQPKYGRIGPVDPRDDPVTRPSILPKDLPAPTPPGGYPDPGRSARGYDPVQYESPTVRAPLPDEPLDDMPTGPTERLPDHPTSRIPTGQTTTTPIPVPRHSRAGGLWTGLVVSAVVLILLLVFVLQNLTQMPIDILFWTAELPIGVAMLFAAIAGMLLVAVPGGLRMLQLRRAARRAGRSG